VDGQDTPETLDAALITFFKALAEPARLRIAGALAGGEWQAGALAAELGLPLAAVARHLAYLVDQDLATVEGKGATIRYRWNVARVRALQASSLDTPRTSALAGAKDERSQVLAAFVRDGRLIRFPVSDAKKRYILELVAARFEAGRTYTEREVNALLKAFADDYSTIRRALVDAAYLNRQDGIYWAGLGHRDAPLATAPPRAPRTRIP